MPTTPRENDRYRARVDMPVLGLTHWEMAYTGSFEGLIPVGTVLVVIDDPPPGASAVGCVPEDSATIESSLVPADDLAHPHYAGFHLSVALNEFGTRLERL